MERCQCWICKLFDRLEIEKTKAPLSKEVLVIINELYNAMAGAETDLEWLQYKVNEGATFDELKECIANATDNRN